MGKEGRREAEVALAMHTVIEEPAVSEAVDDAHEKWARADDAWDAVKWVLARDPEVGDPVTESGRTRSFVLDGARSIGLPTVHVIYEMQNPYIIVHDAKFEEAKYGQAGRA